MILSLDGIYMWIQVNGAYMALFGIEKICMQHIHAW